MRRYLAFTAVACLYCSPGLAQTPTSEASASEIAKPKDHDPDRLVCQDVEIPGSKIEKRRACGTQLEWDEIRRKNREWVEGVQRGVKNGL